MTYEQLLQVGNHVRGGNGKVLRIVAMTGMHYHWFSATAWGIWSPHQMRRWARLEPAMPTIAETDAIQLMINYAPPDVVVGPFRDRSLLPRRRRKNALTMG